jgi:flagellar basal body P-ring protein FlgI
MRRWIRFCAAILILAGCSKTEKPTPKEPLFPTLPMEHVSSFMKGTLYERVRFTSLQPMEVYGYSLVVNLDNTGDSRAPSFVRDYITKQMLMRGFDSAIMGKYQNVTPSDMLKDKRVSIVAVEGQIPPGARQGQSFDVIVRALEHNNTRSLAHGDLYQTDMGDMGLIEPQSIGARQQAYAPGGPVFVNPAYAMANSSSTTKPANLLSSLRVGTVLNGGVVREDRPIGLQLRQPQASTARFIEQLVAQRWQAPTQLGMVHGDGSDIVAKAENEALVLVYVPPQYKGNWKHFLGVVSNLYLNQSPGFLARKANELAALAVKPGAPLADISLCWEALGEPALGTFEPLIGNPDPDVAFAAARAAAFLGDEAARRALLDMAMDPEQHNQLEAVRVLAELPDSPEVDRMIGKLLDSDRADVRIEAYRLLVANSHLHGDGSEDETDGNAGPNGGDARHYGILTYNVNHRFLLDIVPSGGPPMIYATSTGVPRIAVMGHHLTLRLPLTFTAMDMRLSIASTDGTKLLTVFYRDPAARDPEQAETHNDLPEILARLGGEGPEDAQERFNLSFGDVVAVAEQLVSQHSIVGESIASSDLLDCVFELEHPAIDGDQWNKIPTENREGRPQGEGSVLSGRAMSDQHPAVSGSGG